MHRLALLAILLLGLTACHDDSDSDAPLGEIQGMSERTVHEARALDFVGEDDGVTYTLVRVEYGDTPECDPLDDSDCWYSTYCGFVVANQDYPLEVDWVTDADQLFDPAIYCEDGDLDGCDLPGQDLPILDDEAFEDWVYETDADDEPLVSCFDDYW